MEPSSKPGKARQYWVEHVNAWSVSGLSQAEYCRQYDLPMGKFYNWKLKLKSKTIIPVVVQPDKAPSASIFSSPETTIEITLPKNIRCQFLYNINLNIATGCIKVLSDMK